MVKKERVKARVKAVLRANPKQKANPNPKAN